MNPDRENAAVAVVGALAALGSVSVGFTKRCNTTVGDNHTVGLEVVVHLFNFWMSQHIAVRCAFTGTEPR